ncbi:sigma-54 interaction domain-containing protein [Bacilliculturomica massiliensis]|uniref:sigma-54 interaction domain-containing protein n=1 Tax=Bacilliculturomica massiliensis TaxID=1917867 RepID=UPI0013EEEC65|nr:sigma 54-interacting transcriptional regulator [Bacilliculturomica massiliensis]
MLSIGNLVLNSLDYVLIVDSHYNIMFNTRLDQRTNIPSDNLIPEKEPSEYLTRNFFETYPGLDRERSSVVRCMTTGEVVVCKNQTYTDYRGRSYTTNNVTVPIRRKGKIFGVVELVKDIDPLDNVKAAAASEQFDAFVENLQRESGLITFDTIMTRNTQMLKNIEMGKALAKLPNPTLIYGETGTGKELFAQSMINHSGVPKSRAVVLNCAAVPENLVESILFGTERGIYTGAENRKGLFEEADGGILFLDELNSIPYNVQAKLLRVLQDGTFRSLGGSVDKCVDVKVIGAMNVDPVQAMEDNLIRKDLFYRFSSSIIRLTPLRDRKEDIELFVDYYIKYFGDMYGKNIRGITTELREALLAYDWEGNVRELKNVMELMIEFSDDKAVLDVVHLPQYLQQRLGTKSAEELEKERQKRLELEEDLLSDQIIEDENGGIPFVDIIDDIERKLIVKALEATCGNKTRASQLLGLPRQTLKYKIERLRIER